MMPALLTSMCSGASTRGTGRRSVDRGGIVELDGLELHALQAGERGASLVGGPRRDDHRRPRARQGTRRFEADPHVATRHDRDLAVEPRAADHLCAVVVSP
jgi:hypothetical protein